MSPATFASHGQHTLVVDALAPVLAERGDSRDKRTLQSFSSGLIWNRAFSRASPQDAQRNDRSNHERTRCSQLTIQVNPTLPETTPVGLVCSWYRWGVKCCKERSANVGGYLKRVMSGQFQEFGSSVQNRVFGTAHFALAFPLLILHQHHVLPFPSLSATPSHESPGILVDNLQAFVTSSPLPLPPSPCLATPHFLLAG